MKELIETPVELTVPATKAPVELTVSVKGFTFLKDYSAIVCSINGLNEKIILGTKKDFPISELMLLKDSPSVNIKQMPSKIVDGVTYKRFSLVCINF